MKTIYNKSLYIFSIIMFILFSMQHAEEYISFHATKKENIEYQNNIEKQLSDFSLSDIKKIENLSIYKTPNLNLLDEIVTEINSAKSRVYLETYILTEKRIQQALKDAFSRGVEVQVILEKNPYKAYNINNKSYNNLNSINLPIVWSDPKDYSLNHSKFLIIDDHFYISTGNFSYSTFKYNRDFFLKSDDPEILDLVLKVFNHDFIGEEKNVYHPNIVLSPFNSRHYFKTYFESAKETIDLYFQYFKDDALVDLLIEKQTSGIQITAIIPKTALESNEDIISKMEQAGVKFHIMNKNKMHSKVILIDNTYGFIGSINFSHYSLDKNRELGLLIINKEIIKQIIDYFKEDIAKNTVKK